MTLPPAGYHARAVTFGCMAKGKGVSSRANLLISVKVLVGNAVTTGHHARTVSPDYLLNKRKEKAIKDKITKRTKGKNGLGKNASMTGTTRLLQRHPQVTSCILGLHCTHLLGHPLTTSSTYMAWKRSLPGTSLFQWTLAQ
jgi:hypothetical protein